MSQGAYPPGGYEPADGSMPPRPGDLPEPPPGRATARVPQPPAWAPPQNEQPPYGAPQPPPGVYGGGGGFGTAQPPAAPPSSPPPAAGRASGSASVPGAGGYGPQQTFNPPGTYGTPAAQAHPPQPGYAGPEPGRFANLRYDDPAIEQPAKSRRGLVIGIVIAAVVVLALVGAGVFVLLNKTSNSASFAVNSCVKKSDDKAIAASCTETGSYQIVSKVDSVDKCPDKGQPYVVLQENGKPDQVLCLKPAH
jgi:hypothetical protein